ncbi:MAG TPA: hypothetical protein VKE71_06755 [Candidatus Angelobacter sp.]|nr:hypothetical protein [Candidatus Angelobacter sp.]
MLAGKPGEAHLRLRGAIERGNQNFGMETLLPIAANVDTTVADLFLGIA